MYVVGTVALYRPSPLITQNRRTLRCPRVPPSLSLGEWSSDWSVAGFNDDGDAAGLPLPQPVVYGGLASQRLQRKLNDVESVSQSTGKRRQSKSYKILLGALGNHQREPTQSPKVSSLFFEVKIRTFP